MAEDKSIKPDQVEKRSLGTDLAQAAVSGASGGVAGVVTAQALAKLGKKPRDEPKK